MGGSTSTGLSETVAHPATRHVPATINKRRVLFIQFLLLGMVLNGAINEMAS
jgi:hypothetical protein